MSAQSQRVNVSMLSLKWGDVLSMLLPGAVALYAIAPYFPLLQQRINEIFEQTGPSAPGTAFTLTLLIAAALIGGILEGITRILWEPFWLTRYCKPKDVLQHLDASNLDLYERGVQSSYKWVTFYANFAWSSILLLISHTQQTDKLCASSNVFLLIAIAVLLRASHLQWTYYVNYQSKVIRAKEVRNADERSTTRNESDIHKRNAKGDEE